MNTDRKRKLCCYYTVNSSQCVFLTLKLLQFPSRIATSYSIKLHGPQASHQLNPDRVADTQILFAILPQCYSNATMLHSMLLKTNQAEAFSWPTAQACHADG